MEQINVKFKNLSKSSIDPVIPKDGLGSIQIFGYAKDIITSGTTRKISTGLSIILPEGYVGVLSLDPEISSAPWSLVLKNTVHKSNCEDELILEIINAGAYPQKIIQKQPLIRMTIVPSWECTLTKLRAAKVTK